MAAGLWRRVLPWWLKPDRDARADAMVCLLGEPRRAPATAEEERTVALLAREGPLPLRRLVDRVARDMYRDELRHGGWATEIGVVSSTVFRGDAERAVEGAAGALWAIDTGARASRRARSSTASRPTW